MKNLYLVALTIALIGLGKNYCFAQQQEVKKPCAEALVKIQGQSQFWIGFEWQEVSISEDSSIVGFIHQSELYGTLMMEHDFSASTQCKVKKVEPGKVIVLQNASLCSKTSTIKSSKFKEKAIAEVRTPYAVARYYTASGKWVRILFVEREKGTAKKKPLYEHLCEDGSWIRLEGSYSRNSWSSNKNTKLVQGSYSELKFDVTEEDLKEMKRVVYPKGLEKLAKELKPELQKE